ncbi:restriction endonuclease subunit S [Empedobacter falsenii]
MNSLKFKKISELIDVFNNIRVPLSSKQRENIDKIYPYYGAQGIVDYVDNYLFDGEYILVAEDGENLRSNNQNICNLVNGKFWVNNHAHIIKANSFNNIKYLFYNFNRINFEPYVTGSAQPKLNKENLLNIITPVHDLKEQQKIASVLSVLDDKIELNNKINAELEAMAKTLYDYWFVQFDFSDADGKPYKSTGGKMEYNEVLKREIPEGWEVKEFDEVFNISRGTLITKETSSVGNYKVVAAGLNYSYLTGDFNREKYTITVSGSGANAGYVNFWTERIFASDCTTVRGNSDIETFLGLQFLKLYQNYIFSLAKGSAQPHVYPSDIEGLYYVCPPDYLIKTFGKLSFNIYEKISNNLKQNQELAQLRDWLLPMLMNGQIKVDDAEEQVLGIVAEPSVDYQINNLTDKEKKVRRKMLATYIINQSLNDTSFGKTKFEKLLHLVECHIVKGDYNQKYSVQAAGPYDGGFTKIFWNEVTKSKWFEIKEFGKLKRIMPSDNHSKSLKDYGYLSEDLKELINDFISKFKNTNYERPEIISTLFAVWNNRIIRNEMITDALLKKDFLEWDEQKVRYENRLDDALVWMRNNNIVPTGWGNEIKSVKK